MHRILSTYPTRFLDLSLEINEDSSIAIMKKLKKAIDMFNVLRFTR